MGRQALLRTHEMSKRLLGRLLAPRRTFSSASSIAPHELKAFFGSIPAGAKRINLSPSFAEGLTVQQLLDMEPGSAERLLGLGVGSYTPALGGARLRQAIAGLYHGIAAEDVLVMSGADSAVMNTLAALAAPGKRVMLQSPEYPPLRNVPTWRGADVVSWQPRHSDSGGYWWDADEVDRACDRADVVVATVPHSPFGCSPSEDWLRSLAHRADACNQTLVVDEIYRGIDLTDDGTGTLPSACELSARAVVFGGVAKAFGLPGLRVGWVVCRDDGTRVRRCSCPGTGTHVTRLGRQEAGRSSLPTASRSSHDRRFAAARPRSARSPAMRTTPTRPCAARRKCWPRSRWSMRTHYCSATPISRVPTSLPSRKSSDAPPDSSAGIGPERAWSPGSSGVAPALPASSRGRSSLTTHFSWPTTPSSGWRTRRRAVGCGWASAPWTCRRDWAVLSERSRGTQARKGGVGRRVSRQSSDRTDHGFAVDSGRVKGEPTSHK